MITLDGELSIVRSFDGELELATAFDGELGVLEKVPEQARETYTGKYELTPDTEPIVVQCAEKVMERNLTVFKIPLWEVSNPTGTTIYIGGERDYVH